MGRGLLKAHLEAVSRAGTGIADKRGKGYDKQDEYAVAVKGTHDKDMGWTESP